LDRDKIISMYARGMTTPEIQGHPQEMYGIEVSPTLISNLSDAVLEEVKAWQGRSRKNKPERGDKCDIRPNSATRGCTKLVNFRGL
jgi:hypothetical protein